MAAEETGADHHHVGGEREACAALVTTPQAGHDGSDEEERRDVGAHRVDGTDVPLGSTQPRPVTGARKAVGTAASVPAQASSVAA